MVDGNVLREGPDTQVAGSGVDLVADLVAPHVGPDPRHDARDIVSEHERRLVLQDSPELAVAYHDVQWVDARSTHPDKDVTGSDGGIWYMSGAETPLAIFCHDECLHTRPSVVRSSLRSWWCRSYAAVSPHQRSNALRFCCQALLRPPRSQGGRYLAAAKALRAWSAASAG